MSNDINMMINCNFFIDMDYSIIKMINKITHQYNQLRKVGWNGSLIQIFI